MAAGEAHGRMPPWQTGETGEYAVEVERKRVDAAIHGMGESLREQAVGASSQGFFYVVVMPDGFLKINTLYQIHNLPVDLMESCLQVASRQSDPFFRHGLTSSVRLLNEEMFGLIRRMESEEGRRLHAWLDGRGYSRGFMTACHGTRGETGMLALFATEEDDFDAERVWLHFQGLLPSLQTRLMALLAQQSERRFKLLSPRERQCLIWVAEGKTSADISTIMAITPRTVIKHITNATRKLGAKNRTQAVARAILLRFL